ncbi:SGNH hydrolase-type esterase domain-containing protein [Acrodontium crateriforme]|uniref:SGNH hydrolase-type esterase domain-containing protein n=1 Tax=Acrodontium crateriforme TaxID=150365 RepID=A0AAQ3MAG3_9PEZI|nr:SGNH hydrolase-type esterase domain-containing protein [Acrodontium crateriforme]
MQRLLTSSIPRQIRQQIQAFNRNMTTQRLHIAALGSSFASGPNIEPVENEAAGRSKRNYAHQLAEKLDAKLTDLTVSGATILNLLHEPQIVGWTSVFPPQVDSLPTDADIVTVTCGGNDMALGASSEEVTRRFLSLIDKIKEKATKAKIYLVQYPDVYGDATKPGRETAVSAEGIRVHREMKRKLAQANEDAARQRDGVEVVPVAEASRDHAIGSEVPWVDGLRRGPQWRNFIPYHPNLAGHTAVAEMLFDMISKQNTCKAD